MDGVFRRYYPRRGGNHRCGFDRKCRRPAYTYRYPFWISSGSKLPSRSRGMAMGTAASLPFKVLRVACCRKGPRWPLDACERGLMIRALDIAVALRQPPKGCVVLQVDPIENEGLPNDQIKCPIGIFNYAEVSDSEILWHGNALQARIDTIFRFHLQILDRSQNLCDDRAKIEAQTNVLKIEAKAARENPDLGV